jgi:hypothetical protein
MLLSGEMLTAQRLNRLQPRPNNAVGSSNLTLSTTETDLTGASVTATTETAGAYYVAVANFAFDISSATTAFALGVCQLDGVSLTGNARWSGEVGTDFGEASFQWRGPVGAAGSHTWKLRGSMSVGTGIVMIAAFTTLIVTIYEDV